MSQLGVYGTGGFAAEVAGLARRAGLKPYFISDDRELAGQQMLGLPVHPEADTPAVIAIADGAVRRRLADKITAYPALIAASAIVGDSVEFGEGAIIADFAMITARSRIGVHFHCNIYSYVAHDCHIGDFVTFAPRVCCNGNVRIEDDVYVGTGAVIRQGKSGKPLVIGRGAVIGMGAVVTRDVPPGVTVVGSPARVLERR